MSRKIILAITSTAIAAIALFAWSYWHVPVKASSFLSVELGEGIVATSEDVKAAALDEYTGSELTKVSHTQYRIDYRGTGSKVEIGSVDKETIEFKPDITVKHWNDDVSFSLIAPATIDSKSVLTADLSDNKVSASNGEWNFEYFPVEPATGFNEYGGIDIIITAKEKPSSNKIYFTYDSQTVTPYYQGELTPEEIAEGASRPDEVVGSIAFYANDKANHAIGGINYATGKVGHLYAMRAGAEWCRWSIEGDFIVLTIPDKVYSGVYPVVISPVGDTFGYTSAGATSQNIPSDDIYGTIDTGAAGTGVSITALTYRASSGNMKGLLVEHTGNTIVTNGVGAQVGVSVGGWGWVTSTFGTSPTITAQDYAVSVIFDQYVYVAKDTGSVGDGFYDNTNSYTSPTDPTDGNENTTLYSIYCTYTPSGGGTPDISSTPTSEALGVVEENSTYYAYGSAPSNPVQDGECTFTITNSSGAAVDITARGADWTGGDGWILTQSSPGSAEVRVIVYYSGQNPASGVTLNTTEQAWISSLADSATLKWDFKFETGTFTDGVEKNSSITLTGSLS